MCWAVVVVVVAVIVAVAVAVAVIISMTVVVVLVVVVVADVADAVVVLVATVAAAVGVQRMGRSCLSQPSLYGAHSSPAQPYPTPPAVTCCSQPLIWSVLTPFIHRFSSARHTEKAGEEGDGVECGWVGCARHTRTNPRIAAHAQTSTSPHMHQPQHHGTRTNLNITAHAPTSTSRHTHQPQHHGTHTNLSITAHAPTSASRHTHQPQHRHTRTNPSGTFAHRSCSSGSGHPAPLACTSC